jgi:hypothetical protein
LILLLAASLASATCPDLDERVEAARALFNDAELESAKLEIAAAYDGLACQGRVITTNELMALFRLDGLVSLSLEDPKSATYATIRSVAANHSTGAPPAEFGPDLAEMYATWSERLGDQLLWVRVAGAGLVWIDGREVDGRTFVQVAEGEHLIQVRANATLTSEVLDLRADHVVQTGQPGPGPAALPLPPSVPVAVPVEAVPVAPPELVVGPRRHPVGFFVGGVVAGGAGGAAVWWASQQEALFLETAYDADVYRGCFRGSGCYSDARTQEIRGDADRTNAFYAVGYGLSAVGVTLVCVGAVGLTPRPNGVTLAWTF